MYPWNGVHIQQFLHILIFLFIQNAVYVNFAYHFAYSLYVTYWNRGCWYYLRRGAHVILLEERVHNFCRLFLQTLHSVQITNPAYFTYYFAQCAYCISKCIFYIFSILIMCICFVYFIPIAHFTYFTDCTLFHTCLTNVIGATVQGVERTYLKIPQAQLYMQKILGIK